MSVVGFDIGNFKSSIGVARAGGIDIIANEYSDRITPTYVSFTNNERYQGHSAKQQEISNHKNTVSGFKRLIARKMNDPAVQQERTYNPNMRITPGAEGADAEKVMYQIDYLNEMRTFTVEQILATFLTKLRSTAEQNLNTKVVDCVLSCPNYFTDAERRALLDSASIAGLNCLKLMNETTAVALSYGLYNNSLPEPTEKPHMVAFVDMGYTHLQACIVAYHKGKLRVVASTFDKQLGGRDFDKVLVDHFVEDFTKRYKLDVVSNTRARLRLRAECEKLKKLMSSNSSPIPLNIECFMNDVDVTGKMKREDFEKMSEPLLQRVQKTLKDLMTDAKLTDADIDLVEIVGGSTRIPAIKSIIHNTFKKDISTTLNADEACSRGCTLMCAILSPTFKVKDFKIEDCQLFPITLSWKGAETEDNELEVYPRFEKTPLSKLLTIYKKEPFEIEARYRFPNNIPFNDARIGKFYIDNVTPNAQGENSEVKLKARVTKNGIFEISTPQLIETIEVVAKTPEKKDTEAEKKEDEGEKKEGEEEKKEADEKKDESNNEDSMNVDESADKPPSGEAGEKTEEGAEKPAVEKPVKTKKRKTKSTDLALTAKVPQLNKTELNLFIEQELLMIQQDRKEKERSEAKNSVEEYIYDIRDKISNEYEKFILEENKSAFLKLLNETEEWLYSDDAENQEKSVYVEQLQGLKNHGEPVRRRFKESQDRPSSFEELGRSLQLIKKALNLYFENDEKYNHLDKLDIDRIAKLVEDKQKWFEEKSFLVNKLKLTEDPTVLVSEIKDQKDSMDRQSWAVLNKPKPKVELPKPDEAKSAAPAGDASPATGEAAESETTIPEKAAEAKPTEKMDLD